MSLAGDHFSTPPSLILGVRINQRVPMADQDRQRRETIEILTRLRTQPGVILADEVGMGKTYVALAVAFSIAISSTEGPVIIMTPANLIDKWEQDLKTFCELYVDAYQPVRTNSVRSIQLRSPNQLRYDVARHSIELMRLLDDESSLRSHIILASQSAMSRPTTDRWIRLALIAETLRRHGRGRAARLIAVKSVIHRFLAQLLWAVGEQNSSIEGEQLWSRLLDADPREWKDIYNRAIPDLTRHLLDDPVPDAVVQALRRTDLKPLATALETMPVRFSSDHARMRERIKETRATLSDVEKTVWRNMLAATQWISPLLIMDEAHHLKNSDTTLAKQFRATQAQEAVSRTGESALANKFERMLFLTATPFQLGHQELVRVLERFGDVRWDTQIFGEVQTFAKCLEDLGYRLDAFQRKSIGLQRSWARLRPEDIDRNDVVAGWTSALATPPESLSMRLRAALEAFHEAKSACREAEAVLRPWILRHNKGTHWASSEIVRREWFDGGSIMDSEGAGRAGLAISSDQLLPFFLAARGAANPELDLLSEALCSSYEAFRSTRADNKPEKDSLDDDVPADEAATPNLDLSHATWYLGEFDRVLNATSGYRHPKIAATVQKAIDLWEQGEKVVIFAFYRRTCGALRLHLSAELERRTMMMGQRRLREAGLDDSVEILQGLIERIQTRYFDDSDGPGRRAMDLALQSIIAPYARFLGETVYEQGDKLVAVMRRFLRVSTTLIRAFPLTQLDSATSEEAVAQLLDARDSSGQSWRNKFDTFVYFLAHHCSIDERQAYLDAAGDIQTGRIRVKESDEGSHAITETLANIQVATGTTEREARTRMMRAFNTPFFPDILVCSEVMGEGVDLHRFCRYIIHHDLAWNPSTIEQRTGRVDRLGCKAEGRYPISVYRPYLAGTADERQFKVMFDREQWFRVVMGQDEVAKLIRRDGDETLPLPKLIADDLSFDLSLK